MGNRKSPSPLTKTPVLLSVQPINFFFPAELDIVQDMKESLCYVSQDYQQEMIKYDTGCYNDKYQLPDGQEISVGREKFKAPEVLFQPSVIGKLKSTFREQSLFYFRYL